MQDTQEMRVRFLGWEDPLEEDMATHSSMLACRVLDRGAWRAIVHGVTESRIRLKWLSSSNCSRNGGCGLRSHAYPHPLNSPPPPWPADLGPLQCTDWFCSHVSLTLHPCTAEGGNRQNRLHLESRTPSWARLWTLSSRPSVYGNNIPTGKPDPPTPRPPMEEPQGSYLDSLTPQRIH